jgi:hypothetical protein
VNIASILYWGTILHIVVLFDGWALMDGAQIVSGLDIFFIEEAAQQGSFTPGPGQIPFCTAGLSNPVPGEIYPTVTQGSPTLFLERYTLL